MGPPGAMGPPGTVGPPGIKLRGAANRPRGSRRGEPGPGHSQFISDIQTLDTRGQKVILSVGRQNGTISNPA